MSLDSILQTLELASKFTFGACDDLECSMGSNWCEKSISGTIDSSWQSEESLFDNVSWGWIGFLTNGVDDSITETSLFFGGNLCTMCLYEVGSPEIL